MAGVGFRMATWSYTFYLLLVIICYWYITGLSISVTFKSTAFITLRSNVITDGTFITVGSKCYYRRDLYYACVQLVHLCLLWPLHIINGNTGNMFTYLYPLVGCLINTKYLHVGSSNNVRHLRAAVRKYRLGVCKMEKSKIPKLCQNIGLGKLFLEK